MRETRQSGSEGGEGNLPDPYTRRSDARHPSQRPTPTANRQRKP